MANIGYASVDSVLEALVMHTLPDFGPDGASGIINNNFLLSFLKEKSRFEVIDGALEFWSKYIKGRNTNMSWQDHTEEMGADLQDPTERLRYPIQTYAGGAIVINKKHEAMNKGKAMMKSWARSLREQAEDTIPNDFNSAFWNSSPGATEPNSVPSLISSTPTTGSIGGLTRSGRKALQNGADTTSISDIGAEAGVKAMKANVIKQAITSRDVVDLIIMEGDNYSALEAFLLTQRRYKPDTKMALLDFEAIKFGKQTIGFENSNVMGGEDTIATNSVYGINSKWFKFKVLKDGNFIFNPDGFERVGRRLNRALYFWVFCNLCDRLPRAHFVMTDVSNT